MPKKKEFNFAFCLSRDFRYPVGLSKQSKKLAESALLAWVAKPQFKERQPAPAEFIAEAKKRGSKLRLFLEWDDKTAADKHRYDQAQYVLRHIETVKIDIKTSKPIGNPVRAFFPIIKQKSGATLKEDYIPVSFVRDDPNLKTKVLDRAHSDFMAWVRRYEDYAEFLDAFSPVLKAYKAIETKKKRG